jgi:hypothetical protein
MNTNIYREFYGMESVARFDEYETQETEVRSE